MGDGHVATIGACAETLQSLKCLNTRVVSVGGVDGWEITPEVLVAPYFLHLSTHRFRVDKEDFNGFRVHAVIDIANCTAPALTTEVLLEKNGRSWSLRWSPVQKEYVVEHDTKVESDVLLTIGFVTEHAPDFVRALERAVGNGLRYTAGTG